MATGHQNEQTDTAWKQAGRPSGKRGRKPKGGPKGRQVSAAALAEITALLDGQSLQRDELIEYLHLIQDSQGCLSAAHLAALAQLMRLPMAEIWEVASFYDHFDLIKEGQTPPPPRTIRVCNSLSCMLAGSEKLLAELQGQATAGVRYIAAPCLGACDQAPAAADGHQLIARADKAGLQNLAKSPKQPARLPEFTGWRPI